MEFVIEGTMDPTYLPECVHASVSLFSTQFEATCHRSRQSSSNSSQSTTANISSIRSSDEDYFTEDEEMPPVPFSTFRSYNVHDHFTMEATDSSLSNDDAIMQTFVSNTHQIYPNRIPAHNLLIHQIQLLYWFLE